MSSELLPAQVSVCADERASEGASVLLAMQDIEKDAYLEFKAASKALIESKRTHDAVAERFRQALARLSEAASK